MSNTTPSPRPNKTSQGITFCIGDNAWCADRDWKTLYDKQAVDLAALVKENIEMIRYWKDKYDAGREELKNEHTFAQSVKDELLDAKEKLALWEKNLGTSCVKETVKNVCNTYCMAGNAGCPCDFKDKSDDAPWLKNCMEQVVDRCYTSETNNPDSCSAATCQYMADKNFKCGGSQYICSDPSSTSYGGCSEFKWENSKCSESCNTSNCQ